MSLTRTCQGKTGFWKWLNLQVRISKMTGFDIVMLRYSFYSQICLFSPHICPCVGDFLALFPLFLPPRLLISSFLCIPSLYIISLFTDSVFKYWGHPGVAQRGVVCSGGHSAARTPASACTGTRVPPVCKCMTHTKTHMKQQTVTRIYKHMESHVGAHACMNSSSMQKTLVSTDAGKACKACCENTP